MGGAWIGRLAAIKMKRRGKRLQAVNSQNDTPFPPQIAAFSFDRVAVMLVIIGRNGSRWERALMGASAIMGVRPLIVTHWDSTNSLLANWQFHIFVTIPWIYHIVVTYRSLLPRNFWLHPYLYSFSSLNKQIKYWHPPINCNIGTCQLWICVVLCYEGEETRIYILKYISITFWSLINCPPTNWYNHRSASCQRNFRRKMK